MSTDSDSSVIRKKALSGREDFDARAMSWSKAVRLSLERVSDRLFDLQVAVRTVEQVGCSLADLKEVATGDRLLMLLDAYGDLSVDKAQHGLSACGAAILDRDLVQSLVEVQTRGRVTDAALEERAFTYTDAAVTAQLIDPVLSSVDEMMIETPQSPDPLRLRYGDKVEDARALLLVLEAPDYILFRITLDIEDGRRSGTLVLAIPDDMLRPPKPAPDPDEADTGQFDLSGMALSAPISLNAIVARLNMPLSRVCALKPGDLLPVTRNVLSRTELVGSKGFVLAKVVLGQLNGFRAVRLGPDEADASSSAALPKANREPRTAATLQPVELSPDVSGLSGDLPALGDGSFEVSALSELGAGSDLVSNPVDDLGVETLANASDDASLALSGDVSGDLSLDLNRSLNAPPSDAPDLGNLADFSGLDEATLPSEDGSVPDLPDLPSL
ncbi:MAG: FliM/FliN family flagellar motor C-terminal domain-containing protein [Pseudomonadota bacterium]